MLAFSTLSLETQLTLEKLKEPTQTTHHGDFTCNLAPIDADVLACFPCYVGIMCLIRCSVVAELLDAALEEEGGTLMARKVGEAVQNTLGAVVGAIDIPLGETSYQNMYLIKIQ